jgi:hypothetical protein
MKKAIAIILSICMLLSVSAGLNFSAYALVNNGFLCEDESISYSFNSSTGQLVISGSGDIKNYESKKSPFFDEKGIKSIIINNGITAIGANTFESCSELISMEIASSVACIGEKAFYGCKKLTNALIPSGVTSIADEAFLDCTELSDITIPDSVEKIGKNAFYNTKYYNDGNNWIDYDLYNVLYINNHLIKAVIKPKEDSQEETFICNVIEGTKTIADCAFAYIEELTEISLPDSIIAIGESAFMNCSALKEIAIPDNVTIIEKSTFKDCEKLKSAKLSENATDIGYRAFSGCSSLESIVIPDSVQTIGASAFRLCTALKNVTLSNSLSDIGDDAFYCCSSLMEISIPDGVTNIGDFAFYGCREIKSLDLQNSITSIGKYAFSGCKEIKSVDIPDNLTSISDYAFYGCSGLISVEIPDTVVSIKDGAFFGCSSLSKIDIPDAVTSIGYHAFSNCITLEKVVIPCNVTIVGRRAFEYCSNLTSLEIPGGSAVIDSFAFSECTKLKELKMSSSLSYRNSAFNNCKSIEKVTLTKGTEQMKNFTNYNSDDYYAHTPWYESRYAIKEITIEDGVKSIGNNAFRGIKTDVIITVPESITSIGTSAFYGCSAIEKIVIPGSVTSVGNNAFGNCIKLKTAGPIDGGYNIEYGWDNKIPSNAFSGCTSLTSINFPDELTIIGVSAFEECSGLTTINLPDGLTNICDYAFEGCSGLIVVEIPDEVTNLGEYAFSDCSGLKRIVIPDSLTSINPYTFYGCKELKSVVIPDGVESIEQGAFAACDSLLAIEIPVSVTHVGSYSFVDCSELKDIYYIGDESAWGLISVDKFNENYNNANVHFSSTMPCLHDLSVITKENVIAAACTKQGSYDEVEYCSVCGNELSRETKIIKKLDHIPNSAVKENSVEPTYDVEGSYDEVIYCSVCGEELSRTQKTVDKLKKTSLAKATVSGIADKTYTGNAITQSITVKLGEKTLKNGTDYKVTYKNNKSVGKATITVTGINAYSGTISKTFKINPKGTSLSSITAKSKGFTVKWKKQATQTTGYELQYATDSKFTKNKKTVTVSKNSTVSKTISKLTGKKKYYVRIRTYKVVNGTKYYSSWSANKPITTKK